MFISEFNREMFTLKLEDLNNYFKSNEIFNYNVTDFSYVRLLELVKSYQSKIPQSLLAGLDAWGNKLILINGPITDYPLLTPYKGQLLNGIPWDQLRGATFPSNFSIIDINHLEDSVNILLHEQGHAIDSLLGNGVFSSASPDWQNIWKNTQWSTHYDTLYYYEAYADSFANYLLENTTPEIKAYFDQHVGVFNAHS